MKGFNLISAIAIAACMSLQFSQAQVGIGTTTPDNSSMLDITSTDKGILVPRVSLVNVTNGTTPINSPATSLLVYNSNPLVTGGSGIGYYFWDGSEWVKFATKPSTDWTTLGNAGTTPTTNFIGTTDAADLVLRTNNTEQIRIDATGNIGLGQNNPQTEVHVGGNTSVVRVDAFNSTNNANNNGVDLAPVAADANGNLVLAGNTFLNKMEVDATDSDTFLATPVTITSATGAFTTGVLHTETITLTQTTLVEVVFWTGCSVAEADGSPTDDRKPRLFGASVYHTGTGTEVIYSASSYTVGVDHDTEGGTVTTGFFTVNGNGYIELPAGVHTFQLIGYASGGEDGEGVEVSYGNGGSRFQIVNHN